MMVEIIEKNTGIYKMTLVIFPGKGWWRYMLNADEVGYVRKNGKVFTSTGRKA